MFDDFYFVLEEPFLLTRVSENVKVEYKDLCILQSILKYYNGKDKCFLRRFPAVFRKTKKLMIDSGGYNILRIYSDYPFTINEYNDVLNFIKPDYGVSMDYNTASLIAKIGDKYEDRKPYMIKTIDNFIEQYDMDRSYDLIVPIQGNSYDEKIDFIDWLGERFDLKQMSYWGVGGGGITNMGSYIFDSFIDIRRRVCNYLNKKYNNPKIHIFGGNLSFLKSLLKYRFSFTSIDTWSWGIPIKKGRTFGKDLEPIWVRNSGLTVSEAKQRCILRYVRDIANIQSILKSDNLMKLI